MAFISPTRPEPSDVVPLEDELLDPTYPARRAALRWIVSFVMVCAVMLAAVGVARSTASQHPAPAATSARLASMPPPDPSVGSAPVPPPVRNSAMPDRARARDTAADR